jgi:hypothetical protein
MAKRNMALGTIATMIGAANAARTNQMSITAGAKPSCA